MADMSRFADIRIDDSIVKRAARGDVRAYEIIYRAFATPVYSLCLRFTKVPAHDIQFQKKKWSSSSSP